MDISVIIPAHNPRLDYLDRVLAALHDQSLERSRWELVIVDNASAPALSADLALRGHPAGRVVVEERLGLTRARLRGFAETRGEIVLLVDDDNVLAPDYLATAVRLAAQHEKLGCWSGRNDLEFENTSPLPPQSWWKFLAFRQPETASCSNVIDHHESTPWGAGMCIRRAVADAYAELVEVDSFRASLDLQGKRLVYGGDTDIAYAGCERGFSKGVFPELRLVHLIPAERCTENYLLRAIEGQGYSEQLHRLIRHGVMENPRRSIRRWLSDCWYAWTGNRATRLQSVARRRGLDKAWRELPHP